MQPHWAAWELSYPPGMVPSTCNKSGDGNALAHDTRGHKLIPNAASKTFYYGRDVTKEDWVDEGEFCQNLGAELNNFCLNSLFTTL